MKKPRTPLVLLPGLDGTGRLFFPLLNELPHGLEPRVVSYPERELLSYAALLPIARAALPESGPFVLLGESFSGPLAIRLAAEKPPGLKALILAATFSRNPTAVPKGLSFLCHESFFRLWPVSVAARAALQGYPDAELKRVFREVSRSVPPQVMAARARECLGVDVRRELQAVEVPILYIGATKDVVVPFWNRKRVEAERPDAQSVVLRSTHQVLQKAPHAAADAIAQFLASRAGLSID